MRLLLLALGTVAGMAVFGSTAQAQNYPWCAYYGDDFGENCGFSAYEQCMAAISGMSGACEPNNQYVPPAAPAAHSLAPRAHRRWRRRGS
jgi:hypothetical protein